MTIREITRDDAAAVTDLYLDACSRVERQVRVDHQVAQVRVRTRRRARRLRPGVRHARTREQGDRDDRGCLPFPRLGANPAGTSVQA